MDLDELRAFLAVAEAGSFSGASKATGIVRSTLARRIESMERRLDVSLLLSTESGVKLTERGARLAQEGPRVVAEARAVEASIVDRPAELASTIRCAIPPGIHHLGTANITARINARYPKISWRFDTHPKPVACLSSGEADMAIHWGQRPPDGPWDLSLLMTMPVRLVASPEYIDARGQPGSLEELKNHDILLWQAPDLSPDCLPLIDGGEHSIQSKAVSPDVLVLYQMCRMGHGIAVMPWLRIPGDTWAQDQAVPILPDLVGTALKTWLVAPRALADTQAVRVMVEESLNFMRQISGGSQGEPDRSASPSPDNS